MIEIKSPMFLSSFVGTYDNILPKKACTKLIKIFEKSKFVQEQTAGNMVKDSSIRRGTEIFLANDEMKDILIKASFITLDKYIGLTKTTSRFISHHTENCRFEEFRIRKYGKNEGYFKEHCDIVGREGMSRLFVIMFYLNDVKEGGETEFTELGMSIKPQRGSVLIFHPNFMFPHEAKIPISNSKYTAQTYLHYT